ncbi:MAG: hypothetical protein ABI687_12500 [Flavitalea sp.]
MDSSFFFLPDWVDRIDKKDNRQLDINKIAATPVKSSIIVT